MKRRAAQCAIGLGLMGVNMAGLQSYRSKRDFSESTEPKGRLVRGATRTKFVIQQHAARAMHYDFRLEIEGVLVSWAVPKGPSLNPALKRLAIMTDDHPKKYGSFEGVIPEGNYGAGAVILWDKGTYRNIRKKAGKPMSMKECLHQGQIEVFLRGKKLRGAFALIRTGEKTEEKSRWLLIKMRDEYADGRRNITKSEPKSVKSGKTIKEVKRDGNKSR